VGYDALALDGFMVLGERLRSAEERCVVVAVLEQVLRVKLDLEQVRPRNYTHRCLIC
jgi:midasin